MILRAVIVAVAALLVTATPASAGKKLKGVEVVRLAYGAVKKLKGGIAVKVVTRGHANREDGGVDGEYALVVTKGDDTIEEVVWADKPAMELVAFGKLFWVRGEYNDYELTIAPAGKLGEPLDESDAMDLVAAEARRRGIVTDGHGGMKEAGLIRVSMNHKHRQVVQAVVGARSHKLLSFEVDPYAVIVPVKAKGTVSFRVADEEFHDAAGLSVQLKLTNHKERVGGGSVGDWTLTVRKGKKQVEVESGWHDDPWFETIAFGKLVWVLGAMNDAEVVVAAKGKLAKKPIDDVAALALVEAEADRRGIEHDGGGASGGPGVVFVTLSKGGADVVEAVVGQLSKKFLRYEVTAPKKVEPASELE